MSRLTDAIERQHRAVKAYEDFAGPFMLEMVNHSGSEDDKRRLVQQKIPAGIVQEVHDARLEMQLADAEVLEERMRVERRLAESYEAITHPRIATPYTGTPISPGGGQTGSPLPLRPTTTSGGS